MEFLYKRRKKPRSDGRLISDTLMKQVNKVYLVAQTKWAQWMAKKMAKLSHSALVVIWSLFIGISGGYSIYMIFQGFSGATVNHIKITPINKPLQLLQQDHEISKENSSADKDKFEKIIRFRAYIDSLGRCPTGK